MRLVGSEPKAKKAILRHLGCRKVVSGKLEDSTRGQKELPFWGREEQLSKHFGVGGSKDQGSSRMIFIC